MTATTLTAETTKPSLIVSADQYEALQTIARRAMYRLPDVANQLLEEVERAEIRQPGEVPPTVVGIWSLVTFRNDFTGHQQTIRLVYPGDADIDTRRISVLTPIGAALIGLAEGQSMSWEGRDGINRRLTVVKVEP